MGKYMAVKLNRTIASSLLYSQNSTSDYSSHCFVLLLQASGHFLPVPHSSISKNLNLKLKIGIVMHPERKICVEITLIADG